MRLVLVVFWVLFFIPAASAQVSIYDEDRMALRLRLGGQFRFSVLSDDAAEPNRYGFGIRRARLQFFLDANERLQAFAQLDGGEGVQLLDARVSYRLLPQLLLQGGRFFGAQPAGYDFTPFFRLDAVDRAVTLRSWAAGTVGADGRDFGLEAVYTPGDLETRLMLHNGDGNWGRLRGNVREDLGLGDPRRGVGTNGVAVSSSVSWRPAAVPGLDVGVFASVNGSQNPNTAATEDGPGRTYRSASMHAYWGREPGSQPIRLKADALIVDYQENGPAPAQQLGGLVLLGAASPVRGVELFVQGERFSPDFDAERTVRLASVGASVSFSAMRGGRFERARLTGGWSTRLGDDDLGLPGADGFIIQLQLLN